jgi:hypothetical protein
LKANHEAHQGAPLEISDSNVQQFVVLLSSPTTNQHFTNIYNHNVSSINQSGGITRMQSMLESRAALWATE